MMESHNDPPLVFDYQPSTGPNGPEVLLAPLPLSVPGETRVTDNSPTTTSNNLSDDLDDWPTNDTGQGWGYPVFPGFITLEANKADPADLHKPVLLDLLTE